MVFYTSKELVYWIQRWAEQQGLTVSSSCTAFSATPTSKPSARARTRRGRRAGSERRHACVVWCVGNQQNWDCTLRPECGCTEGCLLSNV